MRRTHVHGLVCLAGLASSAFGQGWGEVLPSPLAPAAGGIPGLVHAVSLRDGALQTWDALAVGDRRLMSGFLLADGRSVDLEVERFSVFAPDARVVDVGPTGERQTELPRVTLLRGTVVGEPDSRVFLALSGTGVDGFVEEGGRTWVVANPPAGAQGPVAVYDVRALPEGMINWASPSCGGALQAPGLPDAIALEDQGAAPENLPCRVVRVAVETDFELTQRLAGGTTRVQNYMTTLFGAVSEIYQRDVNTRLEVTFVRTWSANNDPYSSTTVDNRLQEFRNHWNASMGGVSRTIAHLVTGIASGAGGVAWLSSFCNSFAYGTSGYISGNFPYPLQNNSAQNWDVMVVAHEIGHNFGSPHTHDMTPRVDSCGAGDCSQARQGTIMSYCHTCSGGMTNIALTLQTRMINERIVPFLNGIGAACVARSNPPVITAQPQARTVRALSRVQFSASATGSSLAYRWRRGGATLSDDGRISGSALSTLTIDPVLPADAGLYSALVTGSCGSATSQDALLTVRCAGDWTLDGATDFNDLLAYLNDFNLQAPAADLNADGAVDFNDFLEFLNRYNGC